MLTLDTTDLDWPKVNRLVYEMSLLPLTWEGFCLAWEVRRQVFLQGLSVPWQSEEWNHGIWVRLNEALRDFGLDLVLSLDRPEHKQNLQACIESAQGDVHSCKHPLSEAEIREMNSWFGVHSTEDTDPSDWWKKP